MASSDARRGRPASLPLRLAIDALAFAALAGLFVELLLHTQFYATALIVAAGAGMVLTDMFRTAGRADVILSQILDRLTSGAAGHAEQGRQGQQGGHAHDQGGGVEVGADQKLGEGPDQGREHHRARGEPQRQGHRPRAVRGHASRSCGRAPAG